MNCSDFSSSNSSVALQFTQNLYGILADALHSTQSAEQPKHIHLFKHTRRTYTLAY